MNDIRIYDYEFNLLHIEPNIMSAYWILNYNDIGTYEGTFPLTSGICDVVMKNKYLILVQGDFQALITAYLADTKLTVYGKTPNWILTRRTFPAFKTSELSLSNLNPGTIAKHVVSTAFADVDNFECVDLTETTSTEDFCRENRNPVSSVVKECLEEYGLGHRVRLDIKNKKWIFETYSGRKLPVVISEANRNLTGVSVSDDAQSFFCSAWYNKEMEDLGEWNTEDDIPSRASSNYGKYYRIVNESDDAENSRYPNGSYLVCTSTSGAWRVVTELPTLEERIQGTFNGIYDWDTFLSAATLSEAKTELSQKQWLHTLKGTPVHLKYKTDYELGDIFRVQVRKGTYTEDVEKTISGVDVWWENGNIGEKMKFKEDGNVLQL